MRRVADPLAGLDARPVLGDRDDEQHSVVDALLADAPAIERLVGDVLDAFTVERRHDEHPELVPGSRLVACDPMFQVVLVLGREDTRGIGDRPSMGRDIERRRDARTGEYQRDDEP